MKKMSKILSFILLSSFSIGLFGCKKEEKHPELNIKDKITLPKKEGIDSFVYIESDKQLDEITRYDQAMVVVSKEGCQYCDSLLYSLRGNPDSDGNYKEGYIYKTSSIIYLVDYFTYNTCYSNPENKSGYFANHYPQITGTPVVLFYGDGKLVNSRVGHFYSMEPQKIDRTDSQKNYENTKNILDKYLYSTSYYSLNDMVRVKNAASLYKTYYIENRDEEDDTLGFSTDALDEKILETTDKIIVYTWRRCPDCTDLKKRLILPYLYGNEKKLYFYEVDGYFLKKKNADNEKKKTGEQLWQSFCSKFYLNDIPGYENDYGKTGAVPALIFYSGNQKEHETKVYRNDKDIKIDSSGFLYYTTSLYEEVKELRSKEKTSSDDPASQSYQNALFDLDTQRDELELDLILEFLDSKNE